MPSTRPATTAESYALRVVRLDRPEELNEVVVAHCACFPADEPFVPSSGIWLTARDSEDRLAAFAGIEPLHDVPTWAYLSRVGVLDAHRGRGLQRTLMRSLERRARRQGFTNMISATADFNTASANNFIALGYRLYRPAVPWLADGANYWHKELTK